MNLEKWLFKMFTIFWDNNFHYHNNIQARVQGGGARAPPPLEIEKQK